LITAARHQLAAEDAVKLREDADNDVQLRQCTFHPRINLTSKSSVESFKTPDELFQKLHEDATLIEQRKKELLRWKMKKEEAQIRQAAVSALATPRGGRLSVLTSDVPVYLRLYKRQKKQGKADYEYEKSCPFHPKLSAQTLQLCKHRDRPGGVPLHEKLAADPYVKGCEAKRQEEEELSRRRQSERLRQLRQERGPTCLSGAPLHECRCPGHHHDRERAHQLRLAGENPSRVTPRRLDPHQMHVRSGDTDWVVDDGESALREPEEGSALTIRDLERHNLILDAHMPDPTDPEWYLPCR
jgi:hypothetical protein